MGKVLFRSERLSTSLLHPLKSARTCHPSLPLFPPPQTVKNLVNWTHPPKTLLLYGVVALAWLFFLVIPGRYLILGLGLYEFTKVWLGVDPPVVDETPPLAVKIKNLIVR